MHSQEIKVLSALQDFNINNNPSYPVFIPGAFKNSKAVRCWTPEHLASLLGSKEVIVGKSSDGVHRLDPKKGVPKGGEHKMTFSQYVKLITSNSEEAKKLYLQQVRIQDLMPSLHDDINIIIKTFKEATFSYPQLWVGTCHSLVPLHYDQPNNFLIQIYGEKRVLLFSPKQSKKLYMHPFHYRIVHTSQIDSYIDVNKPNLSIFPKLQDAEFIEVILKAGDILYIPPYWWHQVQGLSLNISITYRWDCRFNQIPLYFHFYWISHRIYKKIFGQRG